MITSLLEMNRHCKVHDKLLGDGAKIYLWEARLKDSFSMFSSRLNLIKEFGKKFFLNNKSLTCWETFENCRGTLEAVVCRFFFEPPSRTLIACEVFS